MAEKFTVKADKREVGGKNVNRRLRAEGKLPIVVYGGGGPSVPAVAELRDLAAILRTDTGANTVFSLDIAGEVTNVIFQDRQIDPVKGRLIHADLRRIAKGEKIELTIPIHLVGAPEVLPDGGVLTQVTREIKVLVEPTKAPEYFEADVSNLSTDHAFHVSDLKVPEGVEIHEDPDTVIASIVIVKETELEPQLETAEPEVVDEKGAKEEGEETEGK
jgi:large subunit ribosomal protein L25